MTLEELVHSLRNAKGEDRIQYQQYELVPTNFASYRGYYDEIALGFDLASRARESPSAVELRIAAENAIGEVFNGWKGGQFQMRADTPVWMANQGSCAGFGVVSIRLAYEGCYEIVVHKTHD